MRKFTLLSLSILLFLGQLAAQTRTISGKILSKGDSKPVANATVSIKGRTGGTATDNDGNFTLTVPSSVNTLVVTNIGYTATEISITGKTTITVELATESQSLAEVVVVAYGTAKKGDYTGSIAQINSKDIANRPITNPLNALVGSAPGIQTTTASGQPGSSPAIRLRGFTSYSNNVGPLIVVDGVQYDGGIGNINPEDIESISTLKDASTSSLYGSRGANGVIMVTTKRGSKGKNTLQFKVTQGVTDRAIPEYDRVNAFQYYPLMWEAYRNNLVYTSSIPLAIANQLASGQYARFTSGANIGKQNYNNVAYSDISQLLAYNPFNVPSTTIVGLDGTINPSAKLLYPDDLDWVDAATRQGKRQEYVLSYGSGNERSDFYGSFGYSNEDGWANKSDFRRFSGRISANTQPVKWFRTGINLSGSLVNSNQSATSGIVNPFYFSRYIAPIYPVYQHNATTGEFLVDAQGNKIYDYGADLGRPYNTGRHTIAENLWNQNYLKRNVISARSFADVNFTKDLKFTVNISADIQDALTQGFDNPIVGDGAPSGRADRTSTKTTSYTFNQLLNYGKKLGEHNFSILAGHENYDYTYNYLRGFKVGQIVEGITELPNFATVSSLSSYEDRSKIESYLSRASYDYAGKYFVTGSLRRDGNSKFSRLVRWDNFWALGAGWRLDKESFMNVAWIDMLKLRASYGKVGNSDVGSYYPYQALYTLGRNNGAEPGFTQASLGNDSLTWESAKSMDLGVDFSFFKSRLSGSIEYFNRITDGLIFDVPQPLSNGGTTGGSMSVSQNIGSLYNRGWEVQLTGTVVRTKDFSWNMNVNWTTFKNKMTEMPASRPKIQDGTKQLEKGTSIYDFYLRHYYGVDPTDGAALYSNVVTYNAANTRLIKNGKGGVDTVTTDNANAKYVYSNASSIPDYYGSIGNTFKYKNFDLSVMFTYQVGGKVYDGVYASLMSSGTWGTTSHVDLLNRWQKAGDVTNVPRMDNSKTGIYGAQSDRWLISASYFSLNNINLGYNFSRTALSKIGAQNARIYLSAENVFFKSKRKGMNVNGSFAGTTGDSFSAARIVTAGINLNF
jgi:TonB-linked SusC/RagA family outer membrane protein